MSEAGACQCQQLPGLASYSRMSPHDLPHTSLILSFLPLLYMKAGEGQTGSGNGAWHNVRWMQMRLCNAGRLVNMMGIYDGLEVRRDQLIYKNF